MSIKLLMMRQWIVDNVGSLLWLLALGGAFAITYLNADTGETVEIAAVEYSFNSPSRYSAIDNTLIARLNDGRTIALDLPTGWMPPMPGNQIRVKRIRKLFFGERFVLLRSQ